MAGSRPSAAHSVRRTGNLRYAAAAAVIARDATVKKIKGNPAIVTDAASFKAVNVRADKLGLSKQCHLGPS